MTTNILEQFSAALIERAASMQPAVAAIGRLSAFLWQADIAITSEQSLRGRDEYELVTAAGALKAKLAGRDAGTNIAVLRLERSLDLPVWTAAEAAVGAIAVAYGADGGGGVRARIGIVNTVGGEWASSAGGRLDRYVALDINLARAEEGGPVLDASGRLLGMSTFG